MSKKYEIKDKILKITQNLIDDLKSKPENRNEIIKKFDGYFVENDISDEILKKTIEKISNEFKDFSCEEMLDEIKKMKGGL